MDEAVYIGHELLRTLLEKYPPNHLDVGVAHMRLGGLLVIIKNWPEALKHLNKAYEILDETFAQPHTFKTLILRQIADIYRFLDSPELLLTAYHKWQAEERISGTLSGLLYDNKERLHTAVALQYEIKGQADVKDERYDLALNNFQESLKVRKAFLESDYLMLVRVYEQLAVVFHKMENIADALAQHQLILNILEHHLPSDSRLVPNLELMGFYSMKLKQYHDAMIYFKKRLNLQTSSLSADHSEIAETYYYIAHIHTENEQFSDALVHYQYALDIRLKSSSSTDPELVTNYQHLARTNMQLHRYEEVLLALETCLKIQLVALPSDHIDIADTYKLMALVFAANKKNEDALLYWQKCLEIQTKSLDPGDPELAATYVSVGDAQMNSQNFSDALACYQYALDIRRQSSSPNDSGVAIIYRKLTRAYSLMNPDDY